MGGYLLRIALAQSRYVLAMELGHDIGQGLGHQGQHILIYAVAVIPRADHILIFAHPRGGDFGLFGKGLYLGPKTYLLRQLGGNRQLAGGRIVQFEGGMVANIVIFLLPFCEV